MKEMHKMHQGVRVRAEAVIPENQAGGPYLDNGCRVLPVEVLSVEFNPDYRVGGEREPGMLEEAVKSIQEIQVPPGVGNVRRGTRLTFDLDTLALGGCAQWADARADPEEVVIRTAPYAVTVQYVRPEMQ